MQDLAMQGGVFEISMETLENPAAHGLEQIEFCVAPHQGMTPQPIAKTASGGELSRLSLAIQTVLSRVAKVPTLIFDEVDVGIGGRVAEIVGRMLRELGERHQVMCITHLPQVAACADRQWRGRKDGSGGKPASTVNPLDADGRDGRNRPHAWRHENHRDNPPACDGDAAAVRTRCRLAR